MSSDDLHALSDTEKGISPLSSTTPSTSSSTASSVYNLQIKVEESKVDEISYPEGGLHGWMTLAGAFLAQYASFGYIQAYGIYQDYYVRVYLNNYTSSDIGWIGGILLFLNFSIGAISGQLFDRGYFKYLMLTSIAIHAIALFTLSITHQNQYYQVFLAQGVGLGLGSGLLYVPTLSIVSQYFHKKRPLAMGIVSAGPALGAVLHPIMLNHLFNGHIGYHNGVRISGALNVSLLIISFFMMRTRLPPKKTGKISLPIARYLRDIPYLTVVIAGVLAFCGIFFATFYLQLYSIKHGVDRNFTYYAIPILNAASVFGRTIPLHFAPRIGTFRMMTFFTVGTGIITLSMIAVSNLVGTVLFAIFFGFFSGTAIALAGPTVSTLAKDVNEIGTRIGIYYLFGGFMGLFATSIAGGLMGTQYHWINAILFAGITLIASGLCYSLSGFLAARKARLLKA